jgi:serine/threonine-protein kinase
VGERRFASVDGAGNLRIGVLFAVLGLCACLGQVSNSGGPDGGGPRPDGGSLPDGGTKPDAGNGDAGTDAGTSDAGTDAGVVLPDRFPATSIFYQDISSAPLDPNSAAIIGHLASVGWGSGAMQIDFSLTILHADASVVPRAFTPAAGYYTPDCDMTTVPVPPGGNAEGSSDYACDRSNGDCHVLVYQGTRLYELYNTSIAGGLATGTNFTTLCEVVWDLTHDYWQPGSPYSRGDQCTSADAAGMPIAPLLVTGAELQAGVVPHALRFILPNPHMAGGVYVHPGTHAGAPSGDVLYPPYTARFRLKSSFDLSSLPNAAARAVAVALQKYGMFLDDGGNIPLTMDASAAASIGSHDLAALHVSDFEMVAAPGNPIAITDNCTRTPVTQ